MTRAAPRRPAVLAAALALATTTLAGCITVFPTSPPAQLYRFGYGRSGAESGPPAAPASAGPRTTVLLDTIGLTRAAGSDLILTVAGDQVAYVSGARWDAPASLLFTESVIRSFGDRSQRVQLTPRGGLGRTAATLRLYVRDLEADYGDVVLPAPATGSGGRAPPPPNLPPPTALVAIHARLLDSAGAVIAETDFVARRPATDNRVSAIVPAINASVTEVLDKLVDWADANVPPPAAPLPTAVPRR